MILLIDDDRAVQVSLQLLLAKNGYEVQVASSPREALQLLARHPIDLAILDLNFSIETSGREGMALLLRLKETNPDLPVILLTGWGSIALAVEGMKAGARDFLTKPWQNEHLLQTIHTALALKATPAEISEPQREELDVTNDFGLIIGQDPALRRVLGMISQVAPTDAPVLVVGESGTGKELIAEAIHRNSRRRDQAFVKVNLGGISASLFESEMFGHVRGAFTDARTDRTGRFEMAHRGTIFLDEIGDLDPASQVKLLRVLQDRTFEPLGSSRSKIADVRVICATNRPLEEMVVKGEFREDLFYRINLITIPLPPLRNRSSDISVLTLYFVNNLRTIYQRPSLEVTSEAMAWLATLPFPGNIRQLKNLVERTVLLTPGDLLEVRHFQEQWQKVGPGNRGTAQMPAVGVLTLDEMELQMIRQAMNYHQGNITEAARALGITRFALYRRLEKYGLTDDAEK